MPKHIDEKDKGDSVTKIIGDELLESRQKMLSLSLAKLSEYNNLAINDWYKKQHEIMHKHFEQAENLMIQERKRLLKIVNSGGNELNLTAAQKKVITQNLNEGYQDLLNNAINTHKANMASIQAKATFYKRSNVTGALYEAITEHVTKQTNYGIVEYKNGRNYRWENYMEMKVRTEIQKDISTNMVADATKNGVIFFTCSCYGDCAPDHQEMQEKGIFVDENWENNCPEDRKAEVESYIKAKDIPTIQEAMGERGNYFTTRPNCRHYFQMVDIDTILGIKSKQDLKKERDKMQLNYNGSYEPEKYKALSQQRYNERRIRGFKGELNALEERLNNLSENAPQAEIDRLNSSIRKCKNNISASQANQRQLMKENPFLDRQYNREAYSRMLYLKK